MERNPNFQLILWIVIYSNMKAAFSILTACLIMASSQAIGGNAVVMRKGELTEHNYNEDYNSMVYSRTAYGCSEDGKTLYMIVIDKSTDPVYGKSAGCPTSVMCEIAKHFGCWNMSNFDAGGSAEMMIDYEIVNKTTEATPRPVANGWMVFSIAPEGDTRLASLEFDHPQINLQAGETFTPVILGYNIYGELINKNITDFTMSCPPEIGSCNGKVFTAGKIPASALLTVSVGNLSVSKTVSVAGGSGINGVLVDKQPAHVEYYNISGVKCRKPDTPSIYIRHEGNKTDKIIVN